MRLFVSFCALLWLSLVVWGFLHLTQYANTPGEKNVSYPGVFPAESLLERSAERHTLIFFAHPKCPCTKASIHELARLVTEVPNGLQVYVVFIRPENESEEWTETGLRESAEAIPNVRVVIDSNNRETNIFNAQTSGLILLYGPEGNLRFDGGITAARGHEGDNPGRVAIAEIVAKGMDKKAETLVFGCPLHSKDCEGELMQHAQ